VRPGRVPEWPGMQGCSRPAGAQAPSRTKPPKWSPMKAGWEVPTSKKRGGQHARIMTNYPFSPQLITSFVKLTKYNYGLHVQDNLRREVEASNHDSWPPLSVCSGM
jgi:hypothetical protein